MNAKVPKSRKKWINPKTAPYIFIAPAVLFLLTFMLYPVIDSFITSFYTKQGAENVFVGLQNYTRLFQDELFYRALFNTFILLIFQVPTMLSLAILLAVLLNSALLKARGFFRGAYFLPAVMSLVTASIIFVILLDENNGVVNYLLSFVGIEPIPWLTNSIWAKISIMIVMTWRWTGYNMVILLAGLQGIPKDYYEAASIDGAGKIRRFFSITLPLLKPVLLFTAVLSTIGTLQLFDEPYIITNGGPNNATLTVILYLYNNGFRYFDFGFASAIAYVLVIIIAVLSYVQMKVAGDNE